MRKIDIIVLDTHIIYNKDMFKNVFYMIIVSLVESTILN